MESRTDGTYGISAAEVHMGANKYSMSSKVEMNGLFIIVRHTLSVNRPRLRSWSELKLTCPAFDKRVVTGTPLKKESYGSNTGRGRRVRMSIGAQCFMVNGQSRERTVGYNVCETVEASDQNWGVA